MIKKSNIVRSNSLRFTQIVLMLQVIVCAYVAKAGNIQIPAGYLLEQSYSGDITDDGNIEFVNLYKNKTKSDPSSMVPDRILSIYRDGLVPELISSSESVVFCSNCGGGMGDPFDEISVKKGLLVVTHFGGTGWRWHIKDTYRWQDNAMTHIGRTTGHFHAAYPNAGTVDDRNLSTGLRIFSEKGKKVRAKIIRSSPIAAPASKEAWLGHKTLMQSKKANSKCGNSAKIGVQSRFSKNKIYIRVTGSMKKSRIKLTKQTGKNLSYKEVSRDLKHVLIKFHKDDWHAGIKPYDELPFIINVTLPCRKGFAEYTLSQNKKMGLMILQPFQNLPTFKNMTIVNNWHP